MIHKWSRANQYWSMIKTYAESSSVKILEAKVQRVKAGGVARHSVGVCVGTNKKSDLSMMFAAIRTSSPRFADGAFRQDRAQQKGAEKLEGLVRAAPAKLEASQSGVICHQDMLLFVKNKLVLAQIFQVSETSWAAQVAKRKAMGHSASATGHCLSSSRGLRPSLTRKAPMMFL